MIGMDGERELVNSVLPMWLGDDDDDELFLIILILYLFRI